MAGNNPEKIRGLGLTSTFGFPISGYLEAALFLKFLEVPLLGRFMAERLNLMVKSIDSYGIKRRKLTPAEKRAYEGPFLNPSSFGKVSEGLDVLLSIPERDPNNRAAPSVTIQSIEITEA